VISRDWRCLNPECGNEFHSMDDANPPCPECGCVRVDWIPGGGHLMKRAPSLDRTIRGIADQHGLTNLNSPSHSRLNRAMPKAYAPPINPEAGLMSFGPGFSAPISLQGPVCVPTATPAQVRGSVQIGQRRSASTSVPGPSANAIVEARHRPDRPIR
jgi:hypothetical protein